MVAEPSGWEIATAIGQILAGGSAVVGLFFVGMQLRAASRATDFQILQEFSRGTMAREDAFLNAPDEDKKNQAFVDFLNFLEIHAAAFNGGLLPTVSRKIIADSLANSVAAIQLTPEWAEKVANAVRTVATFDELATFIRIEKKKIDSIGQMMRQQQQYGAFRGEATIKIPESIEFNELSDVCASIHLVARLLEKPTHEVFDWKWIILSIHSAIQGSLVCAISGTAGIGALDAKSAKAMLNWFEKSRNDPGAEYPGERLADFKTLLRRAQSEEQMTSHDSGALSLKDQEIAQMDRLHFIRCQFAHFHQMTWIIELDGITQILLTAIKLVEYLVLKNRSIAYRFDDGQDDALRADIGKIRTLLS